MRKAILFIIFLFIFGLFAIASNNQTMIKIENANIMSIGNKASTNITAGVFPNGLSGYNLTVSIANSSIAEIESIEFPSWATLHTNSSLPSSSVWIKAVDLNKKIEENATNVTLATVKLKSKQEGTTSINISITKIDDDDGYPIGVTIKNATLQVIINHPPSKPTLQAPSSGYTGYSITISAKSSDEDEDKIKYGFDWNNDGVVDEWTNYYNSGVTAGVSHIWNNEGTYSVKVIAEDEYGMKSEWSDVKNIVISKYIPPNQPPTIKITYPSNNATVNGTITMKGTANDDKSVVKVEIRIDGKTWIQATGTTSWSYSIDTTLLINGKHKIEARAHDGSLYSSIASISINVFNNHKPSIIITSPENGSIVKENVIIKGKAWDIDGNDTITKVEIRIDNGTWNAANGTNSWNYSINTKSLSNGMHVVEARCYDGHDYSNIAPIHIEVKNKKGGIPGFEIIFAMVAILAVILMERKKLHIHKP